jgi:short-subunit dehydrogenase
MTMQVAVVTGASSGIGEALSAALAARGTHVVLVARSADRLEGLAGRIRRAGGAASVVPADLAQPGAAQRLHAEIERLGLAVDTLVNNAGLGFHGPFETEPAERMAAQLNVNIVALAELTRLFVPALLARRGAVLNIASTAGFQPSPFMSTYGATKAFVLSFSEALWAEYHQRGLHVAVVCPGPVETPFVDAMGPAVRTAALFRSLLPVDAVVAACLAALKPGARATHVVGFRNRLAAQSSRLSPRRLTLRIGAWLLKPRPSLTANPGVSS